MPNRRFTPIFDLYTQNKTKGDLVWWPLVCLRCNASFFPKEFERSKECKEIMSNTYSNLRDRENVNKRYASSQ